MPLDNFLTRPDFSYQIKQASGTTAFLAGSTNISEKLVVKNIEIDTANAQLGNFLVYDGNRFLPAPSGAYGNTILNGMILSYYTGLTYNISEGKYRINGITYNYTGGSVTITSGNSTYNRFDVVYVTGYSNTYLIRGNPSAAPTVPTLTSTQLEVGIISVPISFTGGTGATVIQTTSATVFEFYNGTGTGIQRSPVSSYNAEAIGDYSFALSRDSKTYGQDTVALGYGTQASGYGQTVVGQFNSPNATDIFIVGNGTSSGSRANAFRVTTGGSTYVTNKLFVSNVEVETTGASSNYALIHDGAKFTPQLLTLQKITESGNTTTNSIQVSQLTGTSIFLSSGFTFISGYNSYSNPIDYTRPLLSDEYVVNGGVSPYGGFPQESLTDIYQLNYFTEKIIKGINPLNSGAYSAITSNTASGVNTAITITVGRESYVAITGITSGDTAIGTIFRNRFQTLNYRALNRKDNSSKNLVGTAFFNQFDSSRFNSSPVLGTLMESHLLGSQTNTRHYEVRNLQLGFFNKGWTNFNGAYYTDPGAINITTSAYDLYINRPIINVTGYNSYNNQQDITVTINSYASIFIESRNKKSKDDILSRPLSTSATITYTNTPWSLFAEADRGYIGSTLVLASAQTLSSTTRGAWLDIGASQATRPHINLSAGTDPTTPQIGDLWWNGTQLYFRKDGSTSVNLLSGGTGSSSTGLTTGTNLGDGVKVLFSSDTTNLGFATLSSQTPSTLRIISSSTGVILFSAVTGSGGSGGIGTLQQVTDSGNTTTNGIQVGALSTDTAIYIYNSNLPSYNKIEADGVGYLFWNENSAKALFTVEDTNPNVRIGIGDTGTRGYITYTGLTTDRNYYLPDRDGTFLLDGYEYMDLSTAQAGGPFVTGQWYRIPVSSRTSSEATNYNTYGDIMLMGVDTNKLSVDGYLFAINSDYSLTAGDYTDANILAGGTTTNIGSPYYSQNIGTRNIVIFNNRHWLCTTSFSNARALSDLENTTYFTALTKDYTSKYGYIIEVDKITYDITNDAILSRQDRRGNIIYENNQVSPTLLERFRFGDTDGVISNFIKTPNDFSYFNILNYTYGDLSFFNNNINSFDRIGDRNFDTFHDQNERLQLIKCDINDNYFSTGDLGIEPQVDNTSFFNGRTNHYGTLVYSLSSQNLVLGSNWYYSDIKIQTATTNTITAITTNASYPITYTFKSYLGQIITFKNSVYIKTEGGLDAVLSNSNDTIEFLVDTSTSPPISYQKNINNYI